MSPSHPYALIAIANLTRAAAIGDIVSSTLHLDTTLARDGDAALQEVSRQGFPALLIVDLSLPRVDGVAVVRTVRRQASDTDTRVVVVAAHESLRAAARELSTSLAISAVLPLDIDDETLRDVLANEGQRLALRGTALVSAADPRGGPGAAAEDVMDRAAIEARRRFKMPIGVGYLRAGEQEHLTFHMTVKGSRPAIAISATSEFSILRQVADALDPLVISDVEDHPVFAQRLSKGPTSIRGFAAVPVSMSRTGARGALCVVDVHPISLSAADIDALVGFGRSVGLELDRVLSPQPGDGAPVDLDVEDVKTLQHLASTDPLTGLANRRAGERHIANEISRAKRERRALSCILLDIDRFKQVNDTLGHQAGDQLLRDVSHLLRRTLRPYDILVRWGGEEFFLVLPGVDLETAHAMAERVRVAVESLGIHGIGPVTISAGVATFETHYDFAVGLKTADERLYRAKTAGRNRVISS